MSNEEVAPPKDSDSERLSDEETQETRKTEEETKNNRPLQVENHDQLFVSTVPPRIICRNFKLDPEKWKRGNGTIFKNSQQIHTKNIDRTTRLIPDDEKRNLTPVYVKSIYTQQSRSEFKSRRVLDRKLRKFVLSKSVYQNCSKYEENMELELKRRKQAYENAVARNIARYVQYAPEDLCEPLRRGVCLWYKVLQHCNLHDYLSKSKAYFKQQGLLLLKLYHQDNFDVDFVYFVRTLHVLLTASNLYPRIYEMETVQRRLVEVTKRMGLPYRPQSRMEEMLDRFEGIAETLRKEYQPRQVDQGTDAEIEKALSIVEVTESEQSTPLKEISELQLMIKFEDDVGAEELAEMAVSADYFVELANRVYTRYVLCESADVNQTDAPRVVNELKRIFVERKEEFGLRADLEFFDFVRKVQLSSLSISADEAKDKSECESKWDAKNVKVLAVLLDGPGSQQQISESDQGFEVEDFFTPEMLDQLLKFNEPKQVIETSPPKTRDQILDEPSNYNVELEMIATLASACNELEKAPGDKIELKAIEASEETMREILDRLLKFNEPEQLIETSPPKTQDQILDQPPKDNEGTEGIATSLGNYKEELAPACNKLEEAAGDLIELEAIAVSEESTPEMSDRLSEFNEPKQLIENSPSKTQDQILDQPQKNNEGTESIATSLGKLKEELAPACNKLEEAAGDLVELEAIAASEESTPEMLDRLLKFNEPKQLIETSPPKTQDQILDQPPKDNEGTESIATSLGKVKEELAPACNKLEEAGDKIELEEMIQASEGTIETSPPKTQDQILDRPPKENEGTESIATSLGKLKEELAPACNKLEEAAGDLIELEAIVNSCKDRYVQEAIKVYVDYLRYENTDENNADAQIALDKLKGIFLKFTDLIRSGDMEEFGKFFKNVQTLTVSSALSANVGIQRWEKNNIKLLTLLVAQAVSEQHTETAETSNSEGETNQSLHPEPSSERRDDNNNNDKAKPEPCADEGGSQNSQDLDFDEQQDREDVEEMRRIQSFFE